MRSPLRSSLRSALMAITLGSVLPLFVMVLWSAQASREHELAEAEEEAMRCAAEVSARQEQALRDLRRTLATLARVPALRGQDAQSAAQLLQETAAGDPDIDDLMLYDGDGKWLGAAKGSADDARSELSDLVQACLQSGVPAIAVPADRQSKPAVACVQPVLGPSRAVNGVLVARVGHDAIADALTEGLLPEDTVMTIVDAAGRPLLSHPQQAAQLLDQHIGKWVLERFVGPEAHGSLRHTGVDGEARIYAYHKVRPLAGEATPLLVIVGLPEAAALARAGGQTRMQLLGLIASTLLALGLSLWLGRRGIIEPLRSLTKTEQRFGAGDMEARAGLDDFGGSIGRLARAFDDMAAAFGQRTRELDRSVQELRNSESRFRAVVEGAPEGILIVADGSFVYVNQAAADLFGVAAPAELLGPIDYSRIDPGARQLVQSRLAMVLEKRQAVPAAEMALLRRDDSTLWAETISVPIEYGETHASLVFVRDIGTRKETERMLNAARRSAEEASRSKDEFLNNMSHEIRTPLHIMQGMLQLLREDVDPERRVLLVEAAQTAGRRLLALLDDILDFANLQARRVNFKIASFSPRNLIGEMEEVFRQACAEKHLQFSWRVADGVSDKLLGDAARIRQVLFNLLGNAVKFTRQGSVELEMWERAAAQSGMADVYFCVSDTGIGISEERQLRIFEGFSQGGQELFTRPCEGAGLGLAIVQRIVRLMGGSISVTSEVDRGTSICVHLRLALPVQDLPAQAPAKAQHSLRILLLATAEGQPELHWLLSSMGHEVVTAVNQRDARDALPLLDWDVLLIDAADCAECLVFAEEIGKSRRVAVIVLGQETPGARGAGNLRFVARFEQAGKTAEALERVFAEVAHRPEKQA